MDDLNEIFWRNVARWQKYRNLTNQAMACELGIKEASYAVNKYNRVGVSVKKLGRYADALEIDPIDLLDEWTDEEWERFVEGQKGGRND